MSTIYTFHEECPALVTSAAGDKILTSDLSASKKKDMTLTVMGSAVKGVASTDAIAFYGVTPVDQGTMTATCLTALTTNPTFSASNTGSGVFGFSSETVAKAYVARVKQMQVDIENLMLKVDSTGLLAIAGVP
jgi:hypothetical protein